MNKVIALGLLLGLSSAYVQAEEASQDLKDASQAVIQAKGYTCEKINNVIPKYFGGSVDVYCDDIYHYTIKDHGGRYVVEVHE